MILNLFRRFLFNDTNNVNITFLLVVLSGFQEVLIRSCMEWKEVFMRRVLGSPPMNPEMLTMKRKYYSYTVTARSILELTSIMISPIMFTMFFDNRFAIDLGYNSMTFIDYESMITSTVLQLSVELMVIYSCSLIEVKSGIPMSDFFYQFRDMKVFCSHLFSCICACTWILYNFKTVPNVLICSDVNNPCSCPSFNVYTQLCGENISAVNLTMIGSITSANLSSVFVGSGNITIIILSILGLFSIVSVTFYIVSVKNIRKFKVKIQQRQQSLMKTIADVATTKMMEQSIIQQAISTIESICRGVSPSQARLLQSVIETLKLQAKVNNVINIEEIFNKESEQDKETKNWLKEQLMTHDQYKTLENKNPNRKTSSRNKILNQRRVSTKIRNSIPVGSYNTPELSSLDILQGAEVGDIIKSLYDFPMLVASKNDENLDIFSWDFNIAVVECKNPQSWLACKAFSLLKVVEDLRIPKLSLSNMLMFVEQNYSLVNYESYSAYGELFKSINQISNPNEDVDLNIKTKGEESKENQYHNNLHGADVFQGVLYVTTKYENFTNILGEFDLFAVLFAAYIHDFNHPGLNTTYMNSDWPSSGISSTFGFESPLEKHHLAMTFNLMRNVDQYNFLIDFSFENLDYFRKIVTDCVLATDLAKSMPWISSSKIIIKERLEEQINNPLAGSEVQVFDEKKEYEYKILLMQLSIKCADVGHPARPLDQHLQWSRRIREEFYVQGDKERDKGRKISPLCDRNAGISNYPQGQIGFINFVSKPCFMILNEVVSMSVEISEDDKPWLKYMNSNTQYWEDRKKEVQII